MGGPGTCAPLVAEQLMLKLDWILLRFLESLRILYISLPTTAILIGPISCLEKKIASTVLSKIVNMESY